MQNTSWLLTEEEEAEDPPSDVAAPFFAPAGPQPPHQPLPEVERADVQNDTAASSCGERALCGHDRRGPTQDNIDGARGVGVVGQAEAHSPPPRPPRSQTPSAAAANSSFFSRFFPSLSTTQEDDRLADNANASGQGGNGNDSIPIRERLSTAMTQLGLQDSDNRPTGADEFFGFDTSSSSNSSGSDSERNNDNADAAPSDSGRERRQSPLFSPLFNSFFQFSASGIERDRLLPVRRSLGHSEASISGGDNGQQPARRRHTPLVSLVLLFVNFSFVVAAITLLMAGVATQTSSVVSLCGPCTRLGTTAIVFGGVLLFTALWGFVALRQRHLLCLLAYVLTVLLLLCGLTGVMALATLYNRDTRFPTTTDADYMLVLWERAVNETYQVDSAAEAVAAPARVISSPLRPPRSSLPLQDFSIERSADPGHGAASVEPAVCRAQREFQCSGFHFGCCRPGVCYDLVPADGEGESEEVGDGEVGGAAIRPHESALSLSALFTADASSPSSSVAAASSATSSSGPKMVPPPWVRRVCPRCPATSPANASTVVCTGEVYTTVRRNLAAFLLMSAYAWLLMASGCLLAWLARRAARERSMRRQRRAQSREVREETVQEGDSPLHRHQQRHREVHAVNMS